MEGFLILGYKIEEKQNKLYLSYHKNGMP